MSDLSIVPSSLKYKSAPSVDQQVLVELNSDSKEIVEYVRTKTLDLSQIYSDERQSCTIFRPTFKIGVLYENTYSGTTEYLPFQYNLYYLDAVNSKQTGIWKGLPQYYEFDFLRPNIEDGHVSYVVKSAYTYNWSYSITYPYANDYNKELFTTLNGLQFFWKASDGIPFVITGITENGNKLISFQCVSKHGLSPGEYVELSLSYGTQKLFEVYSVGNDKFGSDEYIFNLYNLGYTGNTFNNGVSGTFKRVINPENLEETRSEYYVISHKVISDVDDIVMTKSGFELNPFPVNRKFEYSSITPNNQSRISQLDSCSSYIATMKRDIELLDLVDNQKRPVNKICLTIINKGYSGYFNNPNGDVGLKQGWEFNLTSDTNSWWDLNNPKSNSTVKVKSYVKTNGVSKTFYYNDNLIIGDILDGDFCEWNGYEQLERVISKYYQKITYNQNIFQSTDNKSTNPPGYYYTPHFDLPLRVFSNYVEVGNISEVNNVPNYAFFSKTDNQFRWRDIYEYGFKDDNNRGVDYPYLNSAHYPFGSITFRLIPEGTNINSGLVGLDVPTKPLIDNCE